jgi:hypothetical protein
MRLSRLKTLPFSCDSSWINLGPASFAAEQLRPMLPSNHSTWTPPRVYIYNPPAEILMERVPLGRYASMQPLSSSSKAFFEARLESMFGTFHLVSLIKPVQLDHGSNLFRC